MIIVPLPSNHRHRFQLAFRLNPQSTKKEPLQSTITGVFWCHILGHSPARSAGRTQSLPTPRCRRRWERSNTRAHRLLPRSRHRSSFLDRGASGWLGQRSQWLARVLHGDKSMGRSWTMTGDGTGVYPGVRLCAWAGVSRRVVGWTRKVVSGILSLSYKRGARFCDAALVGQ
jgi:hypothetical protein